MMGRRIFRDLSGYAQITNFALHGKTMLIWDYMRKTGILYKRAFALSLFTIFYNIVEGLVSIALGYSDETLTLFGFGADSFIEVISGIGIAVMIIRIRNHPESAVSGFETRALKVTGFAFYLLAVTLAAGIVVNIASHHKPETTFWGIVISLVSITRDDMADDIQKKNRQGN